MPILAAIVLNVEANFALAKLASDMCCWYCAAISPVPSHVLRNDKNISSVILHSLAKAVISAVFHSLLFGSLFNKSIKLFTSELISGIFLLK